MAAGDKRRSRGRRRLLLIARPLPGEGKQSKCCVGFTLHLRLQKKNKKKRNSSEPSPSGFSNSQLGDWLILVAAYQYGAPPRCSQRRQRAIGYPYIERAAVAKPKPHTPIKPHHEGEAGIGHVVRRLTEIN